MTSWSKTDPEPHQDGDEIIYSFKLRKWRSRSAIAGSLALAGMFAAWGVFIIADGSSNAVYLAPLFLSVLTLLMAIRFWRLAYGPFDQVTGAITSKQKKGPEDAWDETHEELFIRLNRKKFGVSRHVYDALSKGDRVTVSYLSYWGVSVGAIVRHTRS